MRHGVAGNSFGRNQTLRKATVRDLAKATLLHQRINTTRAKAAEARKMVDKLITMGKENTLAAKRRAFAVLCDHRLVSALFNSIAPRFANRQGGYTRMIKFAVNRGGDNAEMVLLELTELDTAVLEAKEQAKEAKTSKVEDAQVVDGAGKQKSAKPGKKAEAKEEDKDVKETKGKSKKPSKKE
jgi:large subunit ribosomal protein L17